MIRSSAELAPIRWSVVMAKGKNDTPISNDRADMLLGGAGDDSIVGGAGCRYA